MTLTTLKTDQIEGLISLYFLLINADGPANENEIKMGKLLKEHEGIGDLEFDTFLNKISKLEKSQILKDSIASLNNCEYEWKVKCIAWMSLIANSNGFMAPEEWQLIQHIYNEELKLELSDILEMHKQLPRQE